MFKYMIQRPDADPHESDFPQEYLERVIMFAQEKSITKLWIDKECIYQREEDAVLYPRDKDNGVQIMDIVYGNSTASVGLLSTPLVSPRQVATLSSLLSGSLFVDLDNKVEPKLRPSVKIRKVQWVLRRVFKDLRWSRGWIFQEDHLASTAMTLLIPCNEASKLCDKYNFGTIPGELQVNLARFRRVVTMFCLASSGDDESWPNSDFLSKAKQYNIWNKRIYMTKPIRRGRNPVRLWSISNRGGGTRLNTNNIYSKVSFYPTMTNGVLDDIHSRSLENEEDRIAILANALKFSKRLDISKTSLLLRSDQYSLSAALLALVLMNGEILLSSQYDDLPSNRDIMRHTVRSYLKRCEYKFNAPSFRLEQSFIDRCRLKSPTITSRGILTKGWLFKLLKPGGRSSQPNPLRFNSRDRKYLSQLSRNPHSRSIPKVHKLDMIAQEAIEIFIKKLEQIWPRGRLAEYLHHHLELDRHPPPREKRAPSTSYVLDMMSAVYQALRDDRDLRLARLASEPDNADPVAIFIAPEPHGWYTTPEAGTQSLKMFTSWDSPKSDYDRERLASLKAVLFNKRGMTNRWNTNDKGCFIRSYGWVNGVWDVRGEEMGTYVFPLPGITESSG